MYTNFEIYGNLNHKKGIISHFADFEQVIIKISHSADFESHKISHSATLNKNKTPSGETGYLGIF